MIKKRQNMAAGGRPWTSVFWKHARFPREKEIKPLMASDNRQSCVIGTQAADKTNRRFLWVFFRESVMY